MSPTMTGEAGATTRAHRFYGDRTHDSVEAMQDEGEVPLVPLVQVDAVQVCGYVVFFALVYGAAVVMFRRVAWLQCTTNANDPYLAASRVMGSFHSGALLPVIVPLLASYAPLFPYNAPNSAVQVHVIEWSCAYFAVDVVHMLLFEPSDLFLVVHHLVCIAYYASVLYVGRGGVAMLCAVMAGEVTNPLQNVWYLSKLMRFTRVHSVVSPIFTACFVFVRCVVLPVWVYDIIVNGWLAAYQRGELTLGYTLAWSLMCLLMTAGSFLWSYKMALGLVKFYQRKTSFAKSKSSASVSSSEKAASRKER